MEILFHEAAPIPSHALVALLAVLLGGLQLSRAKGTAQHPRLDVGGSDGLCGRVFFSH